MSDEIVDRFARGEISPAESRELAQRALSDHELFDELTAVAIARHGIAPNRKRLLWPRIAILSAAAAVILGVVLEGPWRNSQPAKPNAAVTAPPILLARASDSNPATFRGADTGSREPRATGSIESIAAGIATIDLGSLDGLAKDSEVDLIHSGKTISSIKLTTVFRDHARGEIASGSPARAKDQVRVLPAARMRASLDQIDAALARGEPDKAMGIAQQASFEGFDVVSSNAEDLNNAGVIAELHGDTSKAIDLYQRASQSDPSEEDRRAIEKNLRRVQSGK
jgi:hypothetical protein